jgi:hypothetical protein
MKSKQNQGTKFKDFLIGSIAIGISKYAIDKQKNQQNPEKDENSYIVDSLKMGSAAYGYSKFLETINKIHNKPGRVSINTTLKNRQFFINKFSKKKRPLIRPFADRGRK